MEQLVDNAELLLFYVSVTESTTLPIVNFCYIICISVHVRIC